MILNYNIIQDFFFFIYIFYDLCYNDIHKIGVKNPYVKSNKK